MPDNRIELGGVHIIRIIEPDGSMSLEVNTDDDIHPWEIIGMIQVALRWELDAYELPDTDEENYE